MAYQSSCDVYSRYKEVRAKKLEEVVVGVVSQGDQAESEGELACMSASQFAPAGHFVGLVFVGTVNHKDLLHLISQHHRCRHLWKRLCCVIWQDRGGHIPGVAGSLLFSTLES